MGEKKNMNNQLNTSPEQKLALSVSRMGRRIVIIGAGAAGRLAASSAKKTDPKARVFLIGKEPNIFIRCSAPYAISGENKLEDLIKPWKKLTDLGIDLIQDEVIEVNPKDKIARTKTKEYPYDSLIFATGADSFIPPMEGADLKNVFTLRTSKDTEAISKAAQQAKSAVIIGGGAVGIEAAYALNKRGLQVYIVEMLPYLLDACLDEEYSLIIQKKLKENGIKILIRTRVKKIIGKKQAEKIQTDKKEIPADLVLVATGVKSNIALAQSAGIEIGKYGIKVDEFMETNIENIYAAGDCTESYCPFTKKEIPTGLAPRAVLEGKIAGLNACGKKIFLGPTIAPFSMKVFNLAIGAVGICEKKAREENIEILAGKAKSLSRHDSMPQAKPVQVKLIFNRDKKIIGGQIIGEEEIAQRLNLISLAIKKECRIEDFTKLEYTSSPELTPLPFAEPIVMAAESVQ